jgi:hypothetical protein
MDQPPEPAGGYCVGNGPLRRLRSGLFTLALLPPSLFLVAMRTVLLWLMMFGVCAGLSARALPASHFQSHSHAHEAGHDVDPWHHIDEDGHHHDDGSSSHGDHDDPVDDEGEPEKSSPQEHHHHPVCGTPAPIASDSGSCLQISFSACLRLDVNLLSLSAPEGPYLDLDAPPLI